MLALALAEIFLKILAAKLGGNVEEVAKIPGLIRKSVTTLNELAVEETGKPIDWDSIKEQHHFSNGGEGGGDPE